MIAKAALIALVVALLLCGWLFWENGRQSDTIDDLQADKASLTLALQAARARQANITEDKKSDGTIDQIPDSDLRNVPNPCWMLDAPPDCGGIQ